jgi:arylsulfatase A-like enzyme
VEETGHQLALRDGDWKLIRFGDQRQKYKVRYALYNLADDLGEQKNSMGQHPERAETMKILLDAIYAGQPASDVLKN